MDDTKKLIEKYKRELMELSRSNPSSANMQKTDNPPQIIGYADSPEAEEKLDRVLKEMVVVPREESDTDSSADDTPVKNSDDFTGKDEITNMDDSVFSGPFPESDAPEEMIPDTDNSEEIRPEIPIPQTTPQARPETLPQVLPDVRQEAEPDSEMLQLNETDERNGSKTEPVEYPETVYTGIGDFEEKNIGRGTIVFRTFAARQAFPVSGVKIVLSKNFGNERYEIATLITDPDGATRPITLPAPSKELSQIAENEVRPFALYDATVTKEGFAKVSLYDIPVFDGVESVQKVSMIPIAVQNNGENNASATENITEEITEVPNADN